MQRSYQILLAILLSILLTVIEIVLEIIFFSGSFEISWAYFTYPFMFFFANYFYLLLLIFASYELEKDKREFKHPTSLRVLGFLLLAIYILFFFLIKTVFQFYGPLGINIFESVSLYVSYSIMPAMFITFFVFGANNERHYGNYATSFAILYLIYFMITLLYDFLVAPGLILGAYGTIIIGTTMSTLQLIMVYLATGYLFFFGVRIKLPHFILISLSWLFYRVYRQLSDLMDTIGAYLGEYFYMLLIIIISLLGIIISIRYFELGKRLKRGLRVFISHSVEDFNRYRIKGIAEYLKVQKKIGHVYFCEVDLIGNIDKWMRKTVHKSQILVFISTLNSLNSKDSIFELDLARKNKLHIIPILGVGMRWEDLGQLNLHREFGSTFKPMEFENFCNELYQHILKYRKEKKAEFIEEKK